MSNPQRGDPSSSGLLPYQSWLVAFTFISLPPQLSPPHTVSSGRIFHLHLTICQKEGDTRCEKLVILLGSFPFKNPFLGQVWFLGFFFSQGNWGKHFYVVLWCLLCAPRIIYTRIIRVVFRPLRYNNRQQGQKAGRYHKFKLTGTHKNYVPAWGTCAGQGLKTGKSLAGSSVGEGGRTYKFSQPCRALSLSLRVPCLNQQCASCLEDVLLGDYSKTRRGTSHKSACSWVFFWWCWSLPMLRSTLLFRYISSLGDVHFDWRITSMEELWERDNTCFSYRLAKESLVIQRTEMPQTNGCVK